jgi:hypothetical protein
MPRRKAYKLSKKRHTPGALADTVNALAPVQAPQPSSAGLPSFVQLRPSEIGVLSEAFQPRTLTYGFGEVDTEHVNELEKQIGIAGELTPPLVMHLKTAEATKWVCIDGHHRIEAYKRAERDEPITCECFVGTMQQAVDESIRRNAPVHLNMTNKDRREAAWKRVVLGWGSKAGIAKLCGVNESTVRNMRKVKKAHEARDRGGELFRKRLRSLRDASWDTARMIYAGVEPVKIKRADRVAKLARQLRQRWGSMPTEDVELAAEALAAAYPDAAPKIAEALVTTIARAPDKGVNVDIKAEIARQDRVGSDEALAEQRRQLSAKLAEIEREIEHRKTHGSRSDLVWQQSVEDAEEEDDK